MSVFMFFSYCNIESASLSLQAFTPKEIIGFSIGSVSSVLYLCSRLPQMYTNVSMTKSLRVSLQMSSFLASYWAGTSLYAESLTTARTFKTARCRCQAESRGM